jgi:hypothetical protein
MKLAFSLDIVLIAATDVCASAWAQPRGGTYAKLSSIFYNAREMYNDAGDRQRIGLDDDQFTSEQAFLYVEHGVADRLTLIGSISGGILKSTNRFVEQKTTGIGDAIVGAKYQLVDQPLVLSTLASIKIPTGYHDTHEPPLGTGDIDVETRLLVAKSLYPLPVYMGVETGHRWRAGPFSNQFLGFAEIGVTPHERLFFKGFVDYRHTRTGEVAKPGLVDGGMQISEGDDTRLGLNGALKVREGLWLDLLFSWAVRGENVGAGRSFGIGFAYDN